MEMRLQPGQSERVSELRYRRLFENAADGILILDLANRVITDANPFIADLLHFHQGDLCGRELWETGLLESREASDALFRELEKNGAIHRQARIESKPGTWVEVEIIATEYKEDGRQVVQCNVRDVTERKKNEQKVAETARLLDLSNDAIIVRDSDGKISVWNKGAEKMYGWAYKEVVGKDLHQLLQTKFPKPLEQITAQIREDGEFNGEVVQIARDGRHIPSDCRWVFDRHTGSILTTYTDISDRKQKEEMEQKAQQFLADEADRLERLVADRTAELLATNQQLEAFVYSIAHDLRAPLRAMQGFSSLLLDEESTDVRRDYAMRIIRSAQFMDTLLTDLLAFSRISQVGVELIPVRLGRVVDFMLVRLQKEIQEKNATVENVGPWPNVLGHEPTLSQVFYNLLSNALKFARPGVRPVVRLRTEDRSPLVRVWVEDNGIGILPEHHARIFRLFARMQGDKYPGTGVGLAIVQKGVERMEGKVGVESVAGEGSRFWFDLRKAP